MVCVMLVLCILTGCDSNQTSASQEETEQTSVYDAGEAENLPDGLFWFYGIE